MSGILADSCGASAPIDLYIANYGNDANSGLSGTSPVKTLSALNTLITATGPRSRVNLQDGGSWVGLLKPGQAIKGVKIFTSASITAGLAGWWRFLEGSGTTVADSSPSGITGTFSGVQVPTWDTGVPGLSGSAISFSGWKTYISLGSPSQLSLTNDAPFSFCQWIYPISGGPQGYGKIFSTGGFNVYFDQTSNRIKFVDRNSVEVFLTAAVTLNAWIHFGVVYSGTDLNAYINGTSVYGPTTRAGAGGGGASYIANSDGNTGAQCKSQDVRFYTRALSSTEMAAIAAKQG